LFLFIFPTLVFGQRTASGRLRVNATIEGSISVVFTASNQTVHTSGSTSATFIVPTLGGSFSLSAAPIASGDSTFLISSPFEIQVTRANLPSASYTLRSWLRSPDTIHSWAIDEIDISGGNGHLISLSEPYGVSNAHRLTVAGPATALGSLTNAITFQVVAN